MPRRQGGRLEGVPMRMFIVSVIGFAGLVSLFAFCAPLRNRARCVVFGQGTMALSRTAPSAAQPERVGELPASGVVAQGGGHEPPSGAM